jgi:hypothetical protein
VDLGYDVTFPLPLGPGVAMYAAMGGLSAVLANRALSVWHDGLRPTMLSLRTGALSRKQVSAISFSLAWGFFWSFGIPFSVGFVIPLVYMIFMLTDWIGVSVPADHEQPWHRTAVSRRGVVTAFGLGAVYGAGMAVLLHFAAVGMRELPVDMAHPVQLFTKPALGAFFLFAVLTIAAHFGIRRALVTLAVASVAWFTADGLDLGNPAAWAFVVAFAALLGQLVVEVRARKTTRSTVGVAEWALDDDDDDDDDDDLVAEQIKRIKSGAIPIVAHSALMGAAFNWGLMTQDPVSGALYASGLVIPALLVMVAWGFAYVPMKFATASVTGCMSTGTFIDGGIALLMPNPVVAAVALGVLRIVEIWSIQPMVDLIEKFPSIREVADVMRTAIFHVMEIAFLIGGGLAALHWAGEWGVAFVVGAWWLNNRANSPVMPMAVGAASALVVGLVANVLHVVGVSLV